MDHGTLTGLSSKLARNGDCSLYGREAPNVTIACNVTLNGLSVNYRVSVQSSLLPIDLTSMRFLGFATTTKADGVFTVKDSAARFEVTGSYGKWSQHVSVNVP